MTGQRPLDCTHVLSIPTFICIHRVFSFNWGAMELDLKAAWVFGGWTRKERMTQKTAQTRV